MSNSQGIMVKHRDATKQLGISTTSVGTHTHTQNALGYRNKQNEILNTSEHKMKVEALWFDVAAAVVIQPQGRSWLRGVLRSRLAWWPWQVADPPPKLWYSRFNFHPHPLLPPSLLAAGCRPQLPTFFFLPPHPPSSARGPVLTDCLTPLKCEGNPIWSGSAKLLHSQPARHDLISQLHATDCNWMNSLAGC